MGESNEIGARIKALREKHGMTQTQLAKKLFISRETVNMWERGARDIKTGMIVALADALRTSCDYLLRGIETKNISIKEELGLTNESINCLRENRKSSHRLRAVNNLLTPVFLPLLEDVYDYFFTDFVHPIHLYNFKEDGSYMESDDSDCVVFLQHDGFEKPVQKDKGIFLEINSSVYENAFLANITDKMKQLKLNEKEAQNAQESNP